MRGELACRAARDQAAGADRTVNLGDITLDGKTRRDELAFASRLIQHWPTEMLCMPGNHDLGDGSGELPLDERLRREAVPEGA